MKEDNNLEFDYEAPLKSRLHRYFLQVTTFEGLWYVKGIDKWVKFEDIPKGSSASSGMRCKSFRAFKRILKKYPILIGKAILANRYQGYSIRSVKNECEINNGDNSPCD